MSKKNVTIKPWPVDCVWPDPAEPPYYDWDPDFVDWSELDEDGRELLDIKEYYDSLVADGFLKKDYTIDHDFEPVEDQIEDYDPDLFMPYIGGEYWDDEKGFDYDWWLDEFTDHMNLLKVGTGSECDPIGELRSIIGYDFTNENLLRQAFTRRAFATEYGLSGHNEEMEFIGDSILNTIVTKEIVRQLYEVEYHNNDAPFMIAYEEGDLTRIRQRFVSGDHLASRADILGLEKYILYGTGEPHTERSKEDVIEAVIGAVAIDCDWNREELEKVVDNLVCVQIPDSGSILKNSYYDLLNSWHQKHFGYVPDYRVEGLPPYNCVLRYQVPDNDKDIWTSQIAQGYGETRTDSREEAAYIAYLFICRNGLWIDLKDSGISPDLEHSINQLQELYQKKYIPELPSYEFEEYSFIKEGWRCICTIEGNAETGFGQSKTQAKKAAAYKTLVSLYKSAGITDPEWDELIRSLWKEEYSF